MGMLVEGLFVVADHVRLEVEDHLLDGSGEVSPPPNLLPPKPPRSPRCSAGRPIEAHCGNRAGIRHTYDELVSLLAELDDATATYSPTHATTALLDELLHEHRRTA